MLTVPTAATDRIEAVPYALAHNISRPLACMRLWDEKATGAGPNALNACIVPFVRPADRRSATRGAFAVMFMCMMCVCMTVRRERGEECWTPLNPRRDATPCTQATIAGLAMF